MGYLSGTRPDAYHYCARGSMGIAWEPCRAYAYVSMMARPVIRRLKSIPCARVHVRNTSP